MIICKCFWIKALDIIKCQLSLNWSRGSKKLNVSPRNGIHVYGHLIYNNVGTIQ